MKLNGHEIAVSHENKVFYPGKGITKGQVIDYYGRIAEFMLPHVKDRPLVMSRWPDGIQGEGFYQKEVPDYFPDWIDTAQVKLKKGGKQVFVVANNSATLAYIANQGCITPHIWLSRTDRLDYPDRMVFDLDPPGDDWDLAVEAAKAIKPILEEKGYEPRIMTTGSKGLHVIVEIKRSRNFDKVREEAHQVAVQTAAQAKDRFTTSASKNDRTGKLYIDVARNAYGQTLVAPYALRAKPGAPVATPITWAELDSLKNSRHYNMETVFKRLSEKKEVW